MKTIEITNVGPIEHAELPCPEGGGIVILKGQQGVGKTTALEAMNVAAGSKGNVALRDRQSTGGVEFCGVTLKIGRNVRRSGEVEVVSLEGRFSVGDLIDPGIIDPAAADARRIKALVQLSGAGADPALFHPLFKGGQAEFTATIDASVMKMNDLVSMADRIKRDCEAAARKAESQAQHLEGKVASGRAAIADIDFNVESDERELQANLEAAIGVHSRLCEKSDAATKAEADAIDAKRKIESAKSKMSVSLEDAQKILFIATGKVVQRREDMLRLEAQLKQAQYDLQAAGKEEIAATTALRIAEWTQKSLDEWQSLIDKFSAIEPVSAAILEGAEEKVTIHRKALEQGAVVRRAVRQKEDADQAAADAKDEMKRASLLRDAAKGTDDVLSAIVAKLGTPLRVEGGRLVLDTPRGPTLFAELSDGERSKLAYSLGIKIVGKGGFFTIPQWAFGELQPANKTALNEEAKASNVLIYTAQATDDAEMQAEVM